LLPPNQTTNGLGHPTPEVLTAVDQQLHQLSAKAPRLPWRKPGGGGGGSRKAGGRRR
jgi:hypothetical protein